MLISQPNFYEIEKEYPLPDPNQALPMHSFIPQGWGQEGVAASVPQTQETLASAADPAVSNFQANHYPPHPGIYGYGIPPPQYYLQAQQGQGGQEALPFPPPYYHPSNQPPSYAYQLPPHGQQQPPPSSDPLQSDSLSVPHDLDGAGDQFQPIKFDDYQLSEKSTSEAVTNTETESSYDK